MFQIIKSLQDCITKNVPGQICFQFENGYGASVIRHQFSYGGSEGLFELAVLQDDSLCYDTPITDDVLGHLEADEVTEILNNIRNLPVSQKVIE